MTCVKLIKSYPYRKFRAGERTVVLPRAWVEGLEAELAKQSGLTPGNHCTYEFYDTDMNRNVVCFTDAQAVFGKTLIEWVG